MSTIYIVRHGQSEANVDPTLYARKKNEDVELTNHGRKQIVRVRELILKDIQDTGLKLKLSQQPVSIVTSPFERCIQSAEILAQGFRKEFLSCNVRTNFLLSEINCGDQQGCSVEDFEQRPTEKHFYDMLGAWQYRPLRGESLMDIHVRAGLFFVQNHFFQYYNPTTVIVSHSSVCLMAHHFLINSCPSLKNFPSKAIDYWPNALARKYETPGHPSPFVHKEDFNKKGLEEK